MVHAAIYEDFLARLKIRAESIKIGDPMEAGCRMGPVVNKSQFERVLNYIKVRAGKWELTGGSLRLLWECPKSLCHPTPRGRPSVMCQQDMCVL